MHLNAAPAQPPSSGFSDFLNKTLPSMYTNYQQFKTQREEANRQYQAKKAGIELPSFPGPSGPEPAYMQSGGISTNTILLIGGAALLAFVLLNKKTK